MVNITDRIKSQKDMNDCDPTKCVLCGEKTSNFLPHFLCFDHWNEWYDFTFGDDEGEEHEEWANSLREK